MKKLSIFLFLMISMISLLAQDAVMVELRKLLYKSTLKESYISEANSYMDENEEQVPFLSYKAMLIFIKAKYIVNPFKKLSYFNEGKEKMEKAVELNPNDVETRFLRLVIQHQVPSFLSYNEHKKSDKEFILKHFSQLTDSDLKGRILLFLKENELLTTEEISQL